MLLERDSDLALLAGAVRALRDGTGGVVLVEGPPGIGKTALLQAGLAACDGGVRVLRARGSELESVLAFGGARQLFAGAVLALGEAERDALLAGPAGLARPVLGLAAPSGATLGDPLYGLFWLAVELAERAPLLLAIDDLHWLDDESGRFAAYLAERLEGVPILLLATARPAEPGAAHGPAATLAEVATVVRPQPLSPDAVGADVHRLTGGNPLFVAELKRALADQPGADLEELGPAAVAKLVLARVARVSPAAEALARAVALFPDGASLDDAAALAGMETGDAAAAADALVAAQVLADGEPLVFLHPVMRRAVYDALGGFARRHGHAQAAARLKARGATPEAIAAHLLAGAPGAEAGDQRILIAAADDAEARRANGAAARYLERALAEDAGEEAARAALRGRLGRLQALLGRPEALETLRQAIGETHDRAERADLGIVAGKVAVEVDARAGIALLEDLRDAAELEPQRRIAVDALLATLALDVDHARFRSLIGRLPTDVPGDTAAERHALAVLAVDAQIRGGPAHVVRKLVLRSLGDTGAVDLDIGGDADDSSDLLVYCGALDVAEAVAHERIDRAAETGSAAAFAAAQGVLANAARARGDLLGAEVACRLGLAARATPRSESFLRLRLHQVLLLQGRLDEATELCTELARDPRSAIFQAMAEGAFDAAIEAFQGVREMARLLGASEPVLLRSSVECADALVASGRREEALELLREYLAVAERYGDARFLGLAHVALGRHSADREHLEHAHALLDPSPYRYEAAQARLELGARLRRDNERSAARELMLPALEYAERQRAAPLEARLRAQLRLVGSRPRSAIRTGVDALTPSEERIARMAAGGMTNKQIAQGLFLTVKTVETHMAGAFRKLDVRSRRELAGILK